MSDPQRALYAYRPGPDALRDKIVMVTGATGGIGRAVSRGVAAYGAQLVATSRSETAVNVLCDEIEQAGDLAPQAALIDFEGATVADYETLAGHLDDTHGRLDGLVLNAAMLGNLAPIRYYDPVLWARVMHVNVHSNFLLTRALLPLLAASQDASIVVTSSSVGRDGRAYWGAYAVSKFALEGLVQVLADELSGDNIRVNSLNPGATRTAMRAQAYPLEDASRLAPPESAVAGFIFLLSSASCDVTGQALNSREGVAKGAS